MYEFFVVNLAWWCMFILFISDAFSNDEIPAAGALNSDSS